MTCMMKPSIRWHREVSHIGSKRPCRTPPNALHRAETGCQAVEFRQHPSDSGITLRARAAPVVPAANAHPKCRSVEHTTSSQRLSTSCAMAFSSEVDTGSRKENAANNNPQLRS
jgi:hypothetical protein